MNTNQINFQNLGIFLKKCSDLLFLGDKWGKKKAILGNAR